ncbi:MAG: hypothetical protein KC502_02220 [Myxococcales bacterium]|nr:hypothetical protein [Myxococcales bacterium]
MTTPRQVSIGMTIACLFNLSIIGVSRGFSDVLGAVDPLFSPAGCQLICIWGLAYLSMAKFAHAAPHIIAVFALEKLFYAVAWGRGLADYQDKVADLPWDIAAFFMGYGILDAAWGLFFGVVWWRMRAQLVNR